MLAEDNVVVKMNHIHNVFRVVLLQELENLELNAGLVVVLLLVLDYLDGDLNTLLMVPTFEGRAERTFAEERFNFKSVAYVIVRNNFIIALLIIVTVVVFKLSTTLHFLSSGCSDEVDFRVV